jgi:serine phosphatase RsbU (regulator of sigma subunit)
MQAVGATATAPAAKVIEHTKGSLAEFRGKASQADDVAIIAVKVV